MLETLTIDELIHDLQSFKRSRGLSGDEKVVTVSNYGDRGNTMQAIELNEIETGTLTETDYSDSGYRVSEEEPENDSDGVIVLNFNKLNLF